MSPLMLLDTASLYFRAYYGVPETLTAPDGTPVNAIRGLLDMIARLVRARHPGQLVACMDADWRPAFRVAAIPSYKAHRVGPDGGEEVPPALAAQVPVIEEVLAAAGVAMAGAPGYEADDVIGTLTARAAGPVEIVTGDRDLFQLVDDERPVRVLYTARGLAKLDVVDEAAVTARYHIPGRAYADYAVLRGDPSDGLPGVAGRGGEDRGRAGPDVRLGRGDDGRDRGGARRLSHEQQAQAGRRARLPQRGAGRDAGRHRRPRAGRGRHPAADTGRAGPARGARRALGSGLLAPPRPQRADRAG